MHKTIQTITFYFLQKKIIDFATCGLCEDNVYTGVRLRKTNIWSSRHVRYTYICVIFLTAKVALHL
jgi:hypothetical protein